jgi:hemolysin III
MMNPVTGEEYIPTTVEQIANTVTHGIPAIFAVVALVFMLVYVVDTPLEALVAWIYGICMILLFSVSSLYHLFTLTHTMDHKLAQFFQTFDHAAIYIFIAASYTPWLLLLEIGANGWIGQLFCLFVWGIAVFGVVKSFTKFAKSISGKNHFSFIYQ